MRRILLTKGKYATVDNCDYDFLSQWNWRFSDYAIRDFSVGGKRHKVYMHRVIADRMGLQLENEIDHKNRRKTDNRRKNLREATKQQQKANEGLRKTNTSGYRGVVWNRIRHKWVAQIKVNGKLLYLGGFDTKILAAKRYDEAAEKYFGKFATFNTL